MNSHFVNKKINLDRVSKRVMIRMNNIWMNNIWTKAKQNLKNLSLSNIHQTKVT